MLGNIFDPANATHDIAFNKVLCAENRNSLNSNADSACSPLLFHLGKFYHIFITEFIPIHQRFPGIKTVKPRKPGNVRFPI